jgi:hypothetical protein
MSAGLAVSIAPFYRVADGSDSGEASPNIAGTRPVAAAFRRGANHRRRDPRHCGAGRQE